MRINLEEDVASKGVATGFERYRFVNCALPEIDLDEVDTSYACFGKALRAPILISCMTGGTQEAQRLNQVLAMTAQEAGFAMGLGSGRVLLERPELLDTFDVRSIAPDVLLFANLGAVQLNTGRGEEECRRLVESLRADVLVLHLNAIQEAIQPEGDTCFRGLFAQIAGLCRALKVPIVVKEVGWGIGPQEVRALFEAGVAAVDLAGAGGTSWSEVERHRLRERWRAQVAGEFAAWGIPTAEALIAARKAVPNRMLIASGGIRTGLDVVKALALGADLVGVAGPFLRAAALGKDAARDLARELQEVLRIAMFGLGVNSIGSLKGTDRIVRCGEHL